MTWCYSFSRKIILAAVGGPEWRKLEAGTPVIQARNNGDLNLESGCVDDSRHIEETELTELDDDS